MSSRAPTSSRSRRSSSASCCFDWQPLPADPALLVHLALVAALMIVFPFSKLLHAPGVFFSPSRNQADNAREQRHAPPARLEAAAGER